MSELLKTGLYELGIDCDDKALLKFDAYARYLKKQNEVMNLTAVEEIHEIETRHFLECAALGKYLELSGAHVIDIGSGAGFPGLPLKIINDSIKLTLLDSQKKRVEFLKTLCDILELPAETIHARAEEQALLPKYRDSFDFAVSRAVARLTVLCELCMPFVKPGGIFAAMKTNHCDEEIAEISHTVKILGGKLENIYDYAVPGTDIVRRVVIIRKTEKTPKGFPRRFSRIQKESL